MGLRLEVILNDGLNELSVAEKIEELHDLRMTLWTQQMYNALRH
jgi:hypothetical protein